jgi:type 1 fimbriae regulatory protein FimB/type 1 fimbriae regulatory protein FimE
VRLTFLYYTAAIGHLPVSEPLAITLYQIDLAQGLVHVARLKNGMASVHQLRGPELRALRRLQREDASAA